MGKTANAQKKLTKLKKKKEKTNRARKLALAQAVKSATDDRKTVVQNSPGPQSGLIIDEATFPTEDNGNSHSDSFASVAKNRLSHTQLCMGRKSFSFSANRLDSFSALDKWRTMKK